MTSSPYDQPPRDVNLDPYGRLIDEFPCKGCGYNLRGQLYNGQCPECGMSVIESVVVQTVVYADPAWLKRLSTGTVLLLCTILASVLMAFGMVCLMSFLMYSSMTSILPPPGPGPVVWTTNSPAPATQAPSPADASMGTQGESSDAEAETEPHDQPSGPGLVESVPTEPIEAGEEPAHDRVRDDELAETANEDDGQPLSPSSTGAAPTAAPPGPAVPPPGPFAGIPAGMGNTMLVMTIASVVSALVIGGLWGAGVWYLTTPEPGTVSGQSFELRPLLRIGTLVYLMLYLGSAVLSVATTQAMFANGPMSTLQAGTHGLLGLVVQVAGVAMLLGLVLHLRMLARRILDHHLTKQTTIVFWGMSISMGLMVIGGTLQVLSTLAVAPNTGMPGTGLFVAAMFIGVFSCFGTLGAMVFLVWGIVLLFLFKAAFTRTAQYSRYVDAGSQQQAPATWNP